MWRQSDLRVGQTRNENKGSVKRRAPSSGYLRQTPLCPSSPPCRVRVQPRAGAASDKRVEILKKKRTVPDLIHFLLHAQLPCFGCVYVVVHSICVRRSIEVNNVQANNQFVSVVLSRRLRQHGPSHFRVDTKEQLPISLSPRSVSPSQLFFFTNCATSQVAPEHLEGEWVPVGL